MLLYLPRAGADTPPNPRPFETNTPNDSAMRALTDIIKIASE